MNDVSKFYDNLAAQYHLIATGWDEEVLRQGKLLKELLITRLGIKSEAKILDCSCGIGTQAIGLALQGYQVTGSDISEKEIKRAAIEAKRLGAKVDFRVADFLSSEIKNDEKFDVIIAFDNAIAHLKNTDELCQAFNWMKKQVAPGGAILISARDYDELRASKPTGTIPRMIEDEFGKRIYFQTWDWNPDGTAYQVNLFVLRPSEVGWSGQPLQTSMRAFTGDEILNAMKEVGLGGVCKITPDESLYYQPVYAGSSSVDKLLRS